MSDKKQCKKCKTVLPITEYYAYKRRGKPTVDNICKECMREMKRACKHPIVIKFPASFAARPWRLTNDRTKNPTQEPDADTTRLPQEAAG